MSRTLYNEGRVVGYSAYEIYCRQLYATDPSETPSDEKAWLAASLAMGSSMLLRVGSDDISGSHYRDIQFPSTSKLSAANTIIASFFIGEGYIGDDVPDTDSVWSTKVTDYGNLLSNTDDLSPSGTTTHSSSIPTKEDVAISDDVNNQVVSYMNITDGIIIQPGTWVTNDSAPPTKAFTPTLSDYPMIRLSFADKVETPFYILLTGFTDKGILIAESTLTSSTDTDNPEDGDFLGPTVFPWSAKIIFSVPPFAMKAVFGNNFKYIRKFPVNSSELTVDSVPIIDMETASPNAVSSSDPNVSKYGSFYDDASRTINIQTIEITRASASVLGTYSINSGSTYLPPALYGSVINSTGINAMYPIDCAAPGSLHLYHGSDDFDSESYSRIIEKFSYGARAFSRDANSYVINEYDYESDEFIPVASTKKVSAFGVLISEPKTLPLFYVEGTSLRNGLTQKYNGTDYSTTGHVGGTNVPQDQNSRDNPDTWYIEVDSSIASEYLALIETITIYLNETDTQEVQGIKGTVAMTDKLMCAGVHCMVYRRLTGKFSEIIKNNCGYQGVFDSSGNRSGQFASDGLWGDNVNADYLFRQIDASNRQYYYAVMPSTDGVSGVYDNTAAFPIRSSDNYIDVTSKYPYDVYINGVAWNIPHFLNNPEYGNEKNAKYLGSWFNALSYTQGALTADTYDNGWALIHKDGVSHPTAYSIVYNQGSGQIYQEYALLPDQSVNTKVMSWLFGGTALANAGILAEFRSLTVSQFLLKALYTDMGTGKPLPQDNPNIKLATVIFTNGYDDTTHTYSKSNMHKFVSLNVSNNATNVGKTQILSLPDNMIDADSNDPTAILINTGRQQSLALSLSDITNAPYGIYGTSGTLDVDYPGLVTWYHLLRALAENKKINIFGANNYIELSGTRLYVSATAPTGTIPDGSIGIGWDSAIHKYTSGAWS